MANDPLDERVEWLVWCFYPVQPAIVGGQIAGLSQDKVA